MALSIDGVAYNVTLTSATNIITLTTSLPNDIILLFLNATSGPVTGISDAAGLNWQFRTRVSLTGQPNNYNESWWAFSANPLSANAITVTQNSAGGALGGWAAGVNGANLLSPFDGAVVTGNSDPLSISTTNPNTIVFGQYATAVGSPTAGGGFTQLSPQANSFQIAEYQIETSPQTNLSVTMTTGAGGAKAGIVDAIRAATPPVGIIGLATSEW